MDCTRGVDVYSWLVPKLWSETIDAHRREVRETILDTTWELVTEHGLRPVTMSEIAEKSGIGRATLYKYFPDVETILRAWHTREITAHLEHLAQVRDQTSDPKLRLEAVLNAFVVLSHRNHGYHDSDLVGFLHRDEHLADAHRQLHNMIRNLVAEGVSTGDLRDDVPPDELATYCLHALAAADGLTSKAALRRLVNVTLAGLRPPD